MIHEAMRRQERRKTVQKPRLVILGEFSAGKSTLINLLTGRQELRTQITATQMPPVWLSHGNQRSTRIDLDGNEHPFDEENVDTLDVAQTAFIRRFARTPLLEICDLIDTPGNSDPNIAADSWKRAVEFADFAVWVSPATQAWRQSEVAAWREIPERIRKNSLLLLSRADMIASQSDRERIEAAELFAGIHLASLRRFKDLHELLRDIIERCEAMSPDLAAYQTQSQSAEDPAIAMPDVRPGYTMQIWRDLTTQHAAKGSQASQQLTLDFLAHLDRAQARPRQRMRSRSFSRQWMVNLSRNQPH